MPGLIAQGYEVVQHGIHGTGPEPVRDGPETDWGERARYGEPEQGGGRRSDAERGHPTRPQRAHQTGAEQAGHDMDNAIKVAYEFYQQHPDETLIVISADHETGGLVLTRGGYKLNVGALKYQKVSENKFTQLLSRLRKKYADNIPWNVMKQTIADYWAH